VMGSGTVYHATRDSRAGTVPSYWSKGYPCFRVATIFMPRVSAYVHAMRYFREASVMVRDFIAFTFLR
jgi:hypothetical protein